MAQKDIAKQVIDAPPDAATLEDLIHALHVRAKFSRGEREIHDGKGIPQEEAKRRLGTWVK